MSDEEKRELLNKKFTPTHYDGNHHQSDMVSDKTNNPKSYGRLMQYWASRNIPDYIAKRLSRGQRLSNFQYFVDGAKYFSNKVWPLFLTTLMTRDLVEFSINPEAKVNNGIAKMLFWFTDNENITTSHWASSPAWPAIMLLTVVGFGASSVFRRRNWTATDLEQFRSENIESPSSHFRDFLGYILTSKTAEEIRYQALKCVTDIDKIVVQEDGDLSVQVESTYKSKLKPLVKYAKQGGIFTRLLAMDGLAYILNNISAKHPASHYLKEKLHSFTDGNATGYQKFYANYLLWRCGQSHQNRYDLLFIPFMLGLTYAKYRFWLSIFQTSLEKIIFLYERYKCEKTEGMQYTYMKQSGYVECNVCGDWPEVPYKDAFHSQTCIDDLLQLKQTPERVVEALTRIKKLGITHINLSQQNWWQWQVAQLQNVTSLINESSNSSLNELVLNAPLPLSQSLTGDQIKVLSDFFLKLKVNSVSFVNIHVGIDDFVQMLTVLKPVKTLDMSGMQLGQQNSTAWMNPLVQFNQLTDLRIANNQLDDKALSQLSAYLQTKLLQTLNLSNNSFGGDGLRAMSNYTFSKLSKLDLSGMDFTKTNLTSVATIANNSPLQELIISASKLDDESAATFLPYMSNKNFKVLDLSKNNLSDKSAGFIGGITQRTSIFSLQLANNDLGDLGFAIISSYLPNSTLGSCNFTGNKISNNGVLDASSYLAKSQLKTIVLSNNKISSQGLAFLIDVAEKVALERLDVSHNPIDDAGLMYIVKSFNALGKSIKQLNLSNTNIKTLKPLFEAIKKYSNIQLEQLELAGNQFNLEDYEQAILLFPGLPVKVVNLAETNMNQKIAKTIVSVMPNTSLTMVDISRNPALSGQLKTLAGELVSPLPDKKKLGDVKVARSYTRMIHAAKSSSNLTQIAIDSSNLQTSDAIALCRVQPSTSLSVSSMSLSDNPINTQEVNLHSCQISSASSLRPPSFYRIFPKRQSIGSFTNFVGHAMLFMLWFYLLKLLFKSLFGRGSEHKVKPISPLISDNAYRIEMSNIVKVLKKVATKIELDKKYSSKGDCAWIEQGLSEFAQDLKELQATYNKGQLTELAVNQFKEQVWYFLKEVKSELAKSQSPQELSFKR